MTGRRHLGLALLALTYFLAAVAGLLLLSQTNNIGLMWPATAILLAFLNSTELRRWPVALLLCWVAGILANFAVGSGLAPALILILSFADVFVDALLAAVLLRRFGDHRQPFGSLVNAVRFIVLACVVPPAIGGALGGGTIALAFGAPFWSEWFKWWASTATSVALLTPLLIQLAGNGTVVHRIIGQRLAEAVALVAVTLGLAALVSVQQLPGLLFVLIPIVLWTAIRFGVTGVSFVTSLLAAELVGFMAAGYGPMAGMLDEFVDRVEFLQLFLASCYVPALLCAVVFEERVETERRLRHAQKMEAVGQLSGGIAHDFNNILAVIRGNIELALQETTGRDEGLRRLETALDFVARGASLSDKLLRVSRGSPSKATLVDVNRPLRDLDTLLTRSLTMKIDVRFELADDLWPVLVDSDELSDAVLNLALNARDALPRGGLLVIETANRSLDDVYAEMNPGSRPGDFVMVSFSDNGTGMSEVVRDRAFEPFYTTKNGGTGLGLAMVYGFVRGAGGHVKIYSEPGVGTTVHLYLPRAKEGFDYGSVGNDAPGPLPRGTETVLVVDDEPQLVEVAAAYLEALGYTCLRAAGASEALSLIESNPGIDLLFSDVIMPGGMDGYALAVAARAIRPEIKVLLTSGFTRKREEYLNGDLEFVGELSKRILAKPYGRVDIAMAVRRALDEAHT